MSRFFKADEFMNTNLYYQEKEEVIIPLHGNSNYFKYQIKYFQK